VADLQPYRYFNSGKVEDFVKNPCLKMAFSPHGQWFFKLLNTPSKFVFSSLGINRYVCSVFIVTNAK
jgi:hypothetical protein